MGRVYDIHCARSIMGVYLEIFAGRYSREYRGSPTRARAGEGGGIWEKRNRGLKSVLLNKEKGPSVSLLHTTTPSQIPTTNPYYLIPYSHHSSLPQ